MAPPRQRAGESLSGCLTPGCRASLASPPFRRLHAARHCCSRSGDRRRQRCPKPLPACRLAPSLRSSVCQRLQAVFENLSLVSRNNLRWSLFLSGSCCLPVSARQNSWARANQQPCREQAHRARHKGGAVCGTAPSPREGRPQRGGGKDVTPEGRRGPNPAVLAVCAPGQAEGCWVSLVLLLTGG